MGSGRDRVTPKELYKPQVHIALQHQGPVVLVLRQAAELLAQLPSHAHLCLEKIKPAEPLERLAALLQISYLLTQRISQGVALAHFWSPVPLSCHQWLSQEEPQREFMLGASVALREGRQQRQAFGEGGDRFAMGIAPGGSVRHLLEIVHGTLDLGPALEVHGELGSDVSGPGAMARFEPSAQALVELCPPRGSQPLVEHLLVQRMPKPV